MVSPVDTAILSAAQDVEEVYDTKFENVATVASVYHVDLFNLTLIITSIIILIIVLIITRFCVSINIIIAIFDIN